MLDVSVYKKHTRANMRIVTWRFFKHPIITGLILLVLKLQVYHLEAPLITRKYLGFGCMYGII